MKQTITILLAAFSLAANGQSVGDSIYIVPGKPLTGIEPMYFRKDWAYTVHETYITHNMPGNTYEIFKVKKGVAYIKAPDQKINDWTPLRFRLDIAVLQQNQTIIIKEKQRVLSPDKSADIGVSSAK
jgi:hypothetical protein